ncbi:MAG: hypothetical protein V4850_03335 [Myxococcota bacterium]
MRFPLPDASAVRLLPALTSPAGLRRWWDPDAGFVGARLAPGLDGPTMALRGDAGAAVVWEGDTLRARFDLAARAVTVDAEGPDAEGLDPDTLADLAAGWELALAGLAWSLGHTADVRWLRIDVPVALAYTDAWSRIAVPDGLAGATEGASTRVRIAGTLYEARVVLLRAPRAVALVLPGLADALVRLQIGPGESVNAAHLDLMVRGDTPLPDGWEAWVAKRFGMSWVTQLGEES